jgi:hypothetical protein
LEMAVLHRELADKCSSYKQLSKQVRPMQLLHSLLTIQLFTSTDPKVFHHLLHPTGEFAARFMFIAMSATPLVFAIQRVALPAMV